MRVLVLGAAVSGAAAARLATDLGYGVVVYDIDPEAAGMVGTVPHAGGRWSPVLLDGIDVVIASPGFKPDSEPIRDAEVASIPVWSELEFASRQVEAPIVAVTGTNGKTTVATLTAEMLEAGGLKAAAVGNIGTPLSEVVSGLWDVLVVEASSFQLRFIETFHPHIAVLLNVAVDHIDWHGSETEYRAAKARIFENQNEGDLLIFGVDDPGASELAAHSTARRLPISGHRLPTGGAGVQDGAAIAGEARVRLVDLQVSGPAFLVDLVAAAAAASEFGIGSEAIIRSARDFRPGGHRREAVGERNGVAWVDDSKATNPHAALAAADAYPSVVLIAGGRDKGLDVTDLARHPNVVGLVAIGEAAPVLLAAAGSRPSQRAQTIVEAVEIAASMAQPGQTVLLAPGCASFDMFDSYEDRGEQFSAAVRALE